MKTLTKGKAETITFQRATPSITLSTCKVYNPGDGEEATTATVDNDDTNTALSTSAAQRANTITTVAALTAGKTYYVTDTTGKTCKIQVIAVEGFDASLRDPLPFGLNTGATVKGIESTATLTIPADYAKSSITLEWTLSDGEVYPDEYLTSKYKFLNPVDSNDLYTNWSRLRGNEPPYQKSRGLEFQPQIDRAVDMIRDKFWRDQYVLDRVRSPALIHDLIVYQTGLLLVDMGYDLSASTDTGTTRKDLRDALKAAYIEVMGATNLWRDEDEDRIKDAGDVQPMGWKMSWS